MEAVPHNPFYQKALALAQKAHYGQKRFSGDDYINHCIEVSKILFEWGLDEKAVAAGLLHDSVKIGNLTIDQISKELDAEIATLVDKTNELKDQHFYNLDNPATLENLRKFFLVLATDLRVVAIKLADRVHNMQTLSYLPESKKIIKAKETLHVYAPLAERLGIGKIKSELEDLSFAIIYKDEYKNILETSKNFYEKADEDLKNLKEIILKTLKDFDIKADVHARKKGLYSLWKKLQRPEINGDVSKIYDIIALRIITDTKENCYQILDLVHQLFEYKDEIGVSDYIARPKPNGYMSIHTKVGFENGNIFEIQIRTKEMHMQAEYGGAAHWSYAEAKAQGETGENLEKGVFKQDKASSWVKKLVGWQSQSGYINLFPDRVFVLSPKGDVYDLPRGATPIDFAFRVHTSLGRRLKIAKVDNRVVPLNYSLETGNVVEIVTSKEDREISRDWLYFVQTDTAKREIKKILSAKMAK